MKNLKAQQTLDLLKDFRWIEVYKNTKNKEHKEAARKALASRGFDSNDIEDVWHYLVNGIKTQ